MGLCLFANNSMINHAETRMIDQNKKPTAVYLAGVMRKGENEVGLLRFYKNVKFYMLTALCVRRLNFSVTFWLSLRPHCIQNYLGRNCRPRAFVCPEICDHGLSVPESACKVSGAGG